MPVSRILADGAGSHWGFGSQGTHGTSAADIAYFEDVWKRHDGRNSRESSDQISHQGE